LPPVEIALEGEPVEGRGDPDVVIDEDLGKGAL
jgi:hypothetical protein